MKKTRSNSDLPRHETKNIAARRISKTSDLNIKLTERRYGSLELCIEIYNKNNPPENQNSDPQSCALAASKELASLYKGKLVALDVETANNNGSSICQIGIVVFENGTITASWDQLVNPQQEFQLINTEIHGIDESSVADAPTFPEIYQDLKSRLSGQFVVSHSKFDPIAIYRAIEAYKLPMIECDWLDSLEISKRAWPNASGYGLQEIAYDLDIQFEHHAAEEDARAAGEIVLCAIRDTAIPLEKWSQTINKPNFLKLSTPRIYTKESQEDEAPRKDEVVFTGVLSMPRKEAAALAIQAGYDVSETVRNSTTIIVTGTQDIRQLAGNKKSSKLRRAEELISQGSSIRILNDSEFKTLLEQENS
jgi:DNA polymerase-3 subunit epsilon